MSALLTHERPAAGGAEGLLILHHGRNGDELDLHGLADAIDPSRRLHVVTPRAPIQIEGTPGWHWYLVPEPGRPDAATFHDVHAQLAELYEALQNSTGIGPERTVLGGFSQGAIVSLAMALDGARPAPAGVLALSGFMPPIDGWEPDLAGRAGMPVFIAHGRADQTIAVERGRAAAERLRDGGLDVEYWEGDGPHRLDPACIAPAQAWLRRVIP
ncbi:MAG TPA: phospholipase [Solirubrobacteraceae bacterium]|jgi:phospholipase/carboxylesterase|nr:phospholipase [Solirubrobacteraceae bacterium]